MDAERPLRYGGLGTSSFVLSLFAATIFFFDLAYAGYATNAGIATPTLIGLFGTVAFFAWFLALISIGLGIGGYRDKSSKRFFSVMGICISAGTLLFSILLVAVSMTHHHS